jgi:hypothetical protein
MAFILNPRNPLDPTGMLELGAEAKLDQDIVYPGSPPDLGLNTWGDYLKYNLTQTGEGVGNLLSDVGGGLGKLVIPIALLVAVKTFAGFIGGNTLRV